MVADGDGKRRDQPVHQGFQPLVGGPVGAVGEIAHDDHPVRIGMVAVDMVDAGSKPLERIEPDDRLALRDHVQVRKHNKFRHYRQSA